jgi:hypothetical protein
VCILINIKDRDNIRVYYYGKSPLALEVNGRRYLFDAAEEGRPSIQMMSFSVIELANSKSPVFATGTLVFNENERNEIFKALGNPEWQDAYWSEDDIDDLLTRPTVDKLNRMVRIRDMLTIERIRGRMNYLRNTSINPPSERVVGLVNARFDEIQRGILKSTKTVTLADTGMSKDAIEAERLHAENEALKKMLAEMNARLDALASAKAEPAQEKKPAGRPKKTE